MGTGKDGFATIGEGLRLHYREWDGPASRPTILCLPGLTRNARDFEDLGNHLGGRFRVLAPSFRGRGKSDHASDPMTYIPPTYAFDMMQFLPAVGAKDVVIVGTSLGGLVGMIMAVSPNSPVKGLAMNDIGPEIDTDGLARIAAHVGKGGNWPDWQTAAKALADEQGDVYPDWGMDDWLAHAKRLCREDENGWIVWDYDPEIATPFNAPPSADTPDLWAIFALCTCPILTVRGEHSDILSENTLKQMAERHPKLDSVTVPRVGHVPLLNEPSAQEALDKWLTQFVD